jgi:hypothetical protein
MKLSATMVKKVVGLAASGLMLIPFGAIAGGPIGASLQTNVNEQDAEADNSNPVKFSVLLTQNNGLPAPNLGGAGTGLPQGWYFRADFNGPSLGCILDNDDVVGFEYEYWGIYTFELAPATNCSAWLAGEYHYAITINKVGRGGGRFRGSALGSFVIPEAPQQTVSP